MTDHEFERARPHDIDAEHIVLGGMMLSQNAVADVVEVMHPRDHYRPAHTLIHEAILSLWNASEPTGPVAVLAALTKTGDIGKVGGAPYLHDLIAAVPTAANAGWYARIVRDHAVRRRLVETGTRIAQLGYDPGGEPADLVERAYESMDDVVDTVTRSDAMAVSDLATSFLSDLEDGKPGPTGIPVPIQDLNPVLGGLRPGAMVAVGGRPGTGKSILIERCATYAARAGYRVLVVSLEMSRAEYVERIYAAEGGVSLQGIRNRELAVGDWDRLAKANATVAALDTLLIHPGPQMTVQDIRAELRAMKRAGTPADLLAIDYLQLMASASRRVENRQAEVSEMSRSLKLLAKEFAIPLLVGAQLNRGPDTRNDHRPILSDLRESGCMPASTRLLLADDGREVTLGELVLSQEQPLVVSVDPRQRLVPGRLTRAFPSGVKPVFRLKLASGREVDATANHPFLTITGWTHLDQLAAGSFIAVPRRVAPPESMHAMDERELILMAHLIGDGSIGPGVKYTTTDPANKDAVEKTANELFGIDVQSKLKGRKWDLWLPSPVRLTHGRYHPVHTWLEPHGLWRTRSGTKFLPDAIFALPDDQLALFLRHLWATDGSITMHRNGRGQFVSTYYATTSRRLADDVQRALLRFGIRSAIRKGGKRGHPICWNVWIQGAPDQIQFLVQVGCHGGRGDIIPDALTVLRGLKPNPNADLVPWEVSVKVKTAISAAGISQRNLAASLGETYCGSYLLGSQSRPRRFARDRLRRMAEATQSAELLDVATSDLFWDRVTAITPLGEMPTFDATVEGTHSFVANGILAHNSIENDCDAVILLHRDDFYEPESPRSGEIDLIVAKNRQGPTTTVTAAFQGWFARIADMARIGEPADLPYREEGAAA